VIALELADLVFIAGRTLGLDTGQVLDLLDVAAAEHALAQARPAGDPAADAAALLHALVRQRPLRRGNQQVALAAMLQFLALNGQDMDPAVPLLVAAMVARLAAGALDTKDVANWLAPRLRPSGRIAAGVKEAPMPAGMFERFTGRARRVIILAQEEARELGHGYVGTEHLLLALLRQGDGVVARVLAAHGADYAQVRDRVLGLLARAGEQASPTTRMVRLPVPAGLADALEQLPRVRQQKAAAVDAGDFESAAALREREQQLRGEILRLAREWEAGIEVPAVIAEEDPHLFRELDRLRDVARRHGIDPDGGTARPA